MIGPDAGEVIAVVQTALLAGFSHPVLRDAIFTHPTMAEAEGVNTLFSGTKQANAAL
jgi:pyruvate/2-oxoglutarate dehydrogenase complex dihydrolipoamide dehydrogenase (E3) component